MRGERFGRSEVQLALVEIVFEDIEHALVGANPGDIGPSAGRFQTQAGLALGQAEDAQACAISLLRMFAGI